MSNPQWSRARALTAQAFEEFLNENGLLLDFDDLPDTCEVDNIRQECYETVKNGQSDAEILQRLRESITEEFGTGNEALSTLVLGL